MRGPGEVSVLSTADCPGRRGAQPIEFLVEHLSEERRSILGTEPLRPVALAAASLGGRVTRDGGVASQGREAPKIGVRSMSATSSRPTRERERER
jgi:hypothetical protein